MRTERKFRCRWCTRSFPAWYTVAGQIVNGGDQLVSHCELEHPEEVAKIRGGYSYTWEPEEE